MATHTTSGNKFSGRTFQISRENGQNDKNGRPYFFEWISELPTEKGNRKFETRTGRNGANNYELFAALSGVLSDIQKEKKSFGETKPPEEWLILYMEDKGEKYKIECGAVDGRYSTDVMKRLLDPNFEASEPLRLSPYAMEKKEGGWNIGLSAHSGTDGKLVANWEAGHLAGMPQGESREWKGQIDWDYSNVANWLFEKVTNLVLPKIQHGSTLARSQAPTQASAPTENGRTEPVNTNVRASAAASAFPETNATNPAIAAGFPDDEPVGDDDQLPF